MFSGPIPPETQVTRARLDAIKAACPTHEQLTECDLILLCGAEYLKDWVEFLYPNFKKVKARKAGWFHESIDYARKKGIEFRLVNQYVDECYLPNPVDAEKEDCFFLPIGVDSQMFSPTWNNPLKPVEIGFVGLLYDKRARFLGSLLPHVGDLEIRFGNLQLLGADTDAKLFRRQTEILARSYREMEILLNLPSLSNVLVMKVLEAMACGTLVVTPELTPSLHERLKLADGKDLVFYAENDPKKLADILRYFCDHDDEREKIAKQGRECVVKHHTLEARLNEIIGDS